MGALPFVGSFFFSDAITSAGVLRITFSGDVTNAGGSVGRGGTSSAAAPGWSVARVLMDAREVLDTEASLMREGDTAGTCESAGCDGVGELSGFYFFLD